MDKTKIITSSGFACEIDESAMDDMEMLDDLVALDEGDITAYPKVIRRLLTDDDKKRLYDHLRDENGKVRIASFGEELADIFKQLKSKKS